MSEWQFSKSVVSTLTSPFSVQLQGQGQARPRTSPALAPCRPAAFQVGREPSSLMLSGLTCRLAILWGMGVGGAVTPFVSNSSPWEEARGGERNPRFAMFKNTQWRTIEGNACLSQSF